MKNLITNKRMKPFTFWIDVHGVEWNPQEMNDEYIKNVCFFVAQGRGFWFFIHNRGRINRLYRVALKRKILSKKQVSNLRMWALCTHGYSKKWPKNFGE